MKVLITGGASGLGKYIVKQLLDDHEVFFTYCKNESSAQALAKQTNTKAIALDLRDENSVSALCKWIEDESPDVLINNALTGFEQKHAHKINSQIHTELFHENVASIIAITNSFIKKARKRKSGKIINVLSAYLAGKPPIGLSQYVAQKNYLLSLNKSWATENIAFNVSSNAISPSIMRTNLTKDTDERVFEQMIDNAPLKRLIEPEEVAEVVEFLLCSTLFLNGQNIVLNQGENLI